MCGAVRYAIAEKPLATALYHCNRCRPQSGSAFSKVIFVHHSAHGRRFADGSGGERIKSMVSVIRRREHDNPRSPEEDMCSSRFLLGGVPSAVTTEPLCWVPDRIIEPMNG